MTTAPTSSVSPPARPRPVADVLLALVLLVLDAVVALFACLWTLEPAGIGVFGESDPDASFFPIAVALGVVGVLVLGTGILAGRHRAYITAVVQAGAGLALLLVAAAGQSGQVREDHPRAPDHSVPHSQCRSGGDSSECLGG